MCDPTVSMVTTETFYHPTSLPTVRWRWRKTAPTVALWLASFDQRSSAGRCWLGEGRPDCVGHCLAWHLQIKSVTCMPGCHHQWMPLPPPSPPFETALKFCSWSLENGPFSCFSQRVQIPPWGCRYHLELSWTLMVKSWTQLFMLPAELTVMGKVTDTI